jgi:5-hydroxyisourate hydrolase-like protein (transthyretin family)
MSRAALVAATLLVAVPGAARADQYIVDHCQSPDGTPGVAFASITGQTSDNCAGVGGGLHHQEGTSQLPNSGDHRDIVLAVPADRPNIQIERMISEFSAPAVSTNPGDGAVFLNMIDGAGTLIYNQQVGAAGVRPTLDLQLPPLDRSLTWQVLCGGATCRFLDGNILNVYRTRLYLNESVAPTLTVTGGTLAAAGSKSGSPSLVFDASDIDSGVASVTVSIDATVVGQAAYPCALRDWSVCKRDQLAQVLQVDTTKVPDGNHELFVAVRDAANNVLTRSLGIVTIANGGGPPVPNGTAASRLAKIAARFTTTKKTSRRLGFTSSPAILGALVTETGQPIAGATVAVLARLRQSGAQPAQIATVTTRADGTFSYTLPGGPSRTVTFAYTAFSGDAKPATTASLKTTVRAIVSARISPRSVRAGKSITLTGRLRLLPRRGVEVKIQARQGNKWRGIDDVRTNASGRFRWRYHFPASQARRTYAFRARVVSSNYPFAATNSKPARVRVR